MVRPQTGVMQARAQHYDHAFSFSMTTGDSSSLRLAGSCICGRPDQIGQVLDIGRPHIELDFMCLPWTLSMSARIGAKYDSW